MTYFEPLWHNTTIKLVYLDIRLVERYVNSMVVYHRLPKCKALIVDVNRSQTKTANHMLKFKIGLNTTRQNGELRMCVCMKSWNRYIILPYTSSLAMFTSIPHRNLVKRRNPSGSLEGTKAFIPSRSAVHILGKSSWGFSMRGLNILSRMMSQHFLDSVRLSERWHRLYLEWRGKRCEEHGFAISGYVSQVSRSRRPTKVPNLKFY